MKELISSVGVLDSVFELFVSVERWTRGSLAHHPAESGFLGLKIHFLIWKVAIRLQ